MNEKRVGLYNSSYGFTRAYHGQTQIGSISSASSDAEREQFHEKMCRLISEISGKTTYQMMGGYFED